MRVTEDEILFIYDSKDLTDREALGYAHSLRFHKIREVDVRERMPTSLQLAQISELLDIEPTDLIDKTSEKYLRDFQGVAMDEHDWLGAMAQSPGLLKTPIAIHGERAEFIKSPKQLNQMDLELHRPQVEDIDTSKYQQ